MSVGAYGLVLAGGIAMGVLGTALYHDSTDPMAATGDLVCEWHGCRMTDMHGQLVTNGTSWGFDGLVKDGTTWVFDDFGSCHAWAAGAAPGEVRWCEAKYGMNGYILRPASP